MVLKLELNQKIHRFLVLMKWEVFDLLTKKSKFDLLFCVFNQAFVIKLVVNLI